MIHNTCTIFPSTGKYYVKIGHGTDLCVPLHSPEEITNWYRGGQSLRVKEFLLDALHLHLPSTLFKDSLAICV